MSTFRVRSEIMESPLTKDVNNYISRWYEMSYVRTNLACSWSSSSKSSWTSTDSYSAIHYPYAWIQLSRPFKFKIDAIRPIKAEDNASLCLSKYLVRLYDSWYSPTINPSMQIDSEKVSPKPNPTRNRPEMWITMFRHREVCDQFDGAIKEENRSQSSNSA